MASNFLIDFFASIFNPILNPIFKPLLSLDPFLSILIITFIITLISTLIYKKMTDQEVLKSIKQEMKEIRNQMKEFKHDTEKVSELQKKSMEKSMMQFKQTMKPMFITMIPILIIFAWFYSHLSFYPIMPNEEFSTSVYFQEAVDKEIELIVPENIELLSNRIQEVKHYKKEGLISDKDIYEANWTLKGKAGGYVLTYEYEGEEYTKELLITSENEYEEPSKRVSDSDIKEIKINNRELEIFGLRWFWIYLISAIIFNTLLRKLMKVH